MRSTSRSIRGYLFAALMLALAVAFQLKPGEYFRPSGADVSGVPKNTAKYHRSPCPGLNSLANHGHLPRDGKALTPALVKEAIIQVYNLEPSLANKLAGTLPDSFTLADLGKHNWIEHDASLVHDDAYFGQDPSSINATLVDELVSKHADKSTNTISVKQLAHFRRDREDECAATNPDYTFGLKQQGGAYAEAAALMLVMGNSEEGSISIDHVRSFLQEEKLPSDYEKPKDPVTLSSALYLAAKIKFLSRWPWFAETE